MHPSFQCSKCGIQCNGEILSRWGQGLASLELVGEIGAGYGGVCIWWGIGGGALVQV